ncbi:hypothetical protein CY35_04G081900 [Sphagnum magellanicum]|nr:hypothetical protein CY35_04G081900 [Sphagnum magellanicum]
MGTLKRKWLCRGIKRTRVKRVVVMLVMLNALQLLVYLIHSWGGENAPSKFPPIPNLDPVSCEAFFGNGFTQTFRVLESERRLSMNLTRKSELLDRSSFRFNLKEALGAWTLSKSKQSQGDEGRLTGVADVHTTNTTLEATHIQSLRESLFRCFYSETLRTCICEGKNMVMNPKKTKMAKGGEPLESVMRRNEEEELPRFTSGAFQIIVPEGERKPLFNKTLLQHLMPQGLIQEHLFEQIHTIPVNKVTCAQIVTQPAMVVTRFEYANLFHTVTDWYSVYMTAWIANLKHMDDGWQAMFSGLNFSKHLAGPVYFNHLIFTPLGYHSSLFKGLSQGIFCKGGSASDEEKDSQTPRLQEFEDYLAHPRHTGKPEPCISNEEELLDALKTWASQRGGSDKLGVSVVNGLFAHMPMEEQLQEVQESSIIVGAHGAGLAHLLFARPEKTAILELVTPGFKHPHFPAMSHWMGMEYHAIKMRSPEADCSELTDHVDNMQSLRITP